MSALDLLKSGDLSAALAAVQADVRTDPSAAKHRIFLFQLLCVLGDWNKAVMQLRLAAQMDESATPMAQTYREAIGCELVRERVFRGETAPLVLGEPQQWSALLIEALAPLARGDHATAERLRGEAFEMAPATSGEIDGTRFEWMADADMRFGPMLEVIVNGKYFWAPFDSIMQIDIDPPTDLRDRVWTPAMITWAAGGETPALIPTRYPGTAELPEDVMRLARETRWEEAGEGLFVGLGQRVIATDAEEYGLMDIRKIVLDVEEVTEPGDAAAEPDVAEVPAAEKGDG
ncbi:type VI secretion system accessory protein TagJ [Paralimibaculum aggregatum]|uniref:Type VI secretion system accessory protein TagJ n=1 Tax=Paralimibaculum aggregatum TaxID=3036245 RepID=A0ABQ6LMV9_9RHOB|nr:type VI secretion system accessory protein TagJ [Limibaculum sp. NKW23]GMG81610.1 type VI secretion system accessory protein TagJ [Limibaculum sp. NKW23]